MPFYDGPAKYCGNVGSVNLQDHVRPNSSKTPNGRYTLPVFTGREDVIFGHP